MIGVGRLPAAAVGLIVALGVAVSTISRSPAEAVPIVLTAVTAAAAGAGLLWIPIRRRVDRVAVGLEQSVSQAPANAHAASHTSALARLALAAEAATLSIAQVTTAATTDALTRVANRSTLVSQLGFELERSRRHSRPLSVAFIDIDHFKTVNDTYGHGAGDLVLAGVARLVSDNIRMIDTFGRYGGEEFLLLLPETDATSAAETAERLRQLIGRERFTLPDGRRLSLTVSIGVAGGRGRDLTVETLIRDADAAMYSAKSLGRNQVYVFEIPSDDGVVLRAPVDPASRALGQRLGVSARDAAEERLIETLRTLGAAAQPGRYVEVAAVEVARQLGMGESEVEAIRVAAVFHDAGMAAVPAEVIDRAYALDPTALQQVRQHPRVSHLMLEEASRLRDAAEIVLHHHERFAGHGYPHGLHGSEIPLGARVLAVADAYEAMREERPHRRAMTHKEALREIQRQAGTQFDPRVVALFCGLYAAQPPSGEARPVVTNTGHTHGPVARNARQRGVAGRRSSRAG